MNNKGTKYGIILLLIILALTGANLLFGSVNIPAEAVWHILTGNEVEKASWSFIVWESRLPQAITALLCGMALAASGLMLQTTFNNPLADPSSIIAQMVRYKIQQTRLPGTRYTPTLSASHACPVLGMNLACSPHLPDGCKNVTQQHSRICLF